ncbi:MAG: HD domain-containing protein [Treponema sp.]|jgi:exopolyphosphatase/guanosine-5'-triphosphate,3'-diphosphate pyrophosphatase|nr:HD domain-containing protein [Treponema sp.]
METKPRLVAVLEIGSTGIRLLLAEIHPQGRWKVLDQAGKPVALGRDVFTSGQISRESLMECLLVLRGFRELLSGWDIAGEDIHVIATSAIRAARNRDMFADRLRQEMGLGLSIVEGIEENRLMYMAARYALKNDLPMFWRANSMILEVGGGSTEIMLLRRGQMVAAHSFKIGTIHIGRTSRFDTASSRERFFNENLRNTAEILDGEMDLSYVRTFIIAGSDARIAAASAGKILNDNCRIISRDAFIEFVTGIQNYSVEDCMEKLGLSFADAEGLIPGLLVYKNLLERTGAAQIVVPQISIREGLLIDLARGVDSAMQEEFISQVSASAVNLGRRYHFDEPHARHVARLCLILFDALIREHGMNRRERMVLEIAALLHDVGTYIKPSGHQMHGQYIVANSEIFGIQPDELNIIANVVRYHRGPPPSSTDIAYLALQREERVLVLKMASLLRVADALDRGHSRRVMKIAVERKNEALILRTSGNLDMSLELISLEEKAGLFQEVFGYKIILS